MKCYEPEIVRLKNPVWSVFDRNYITSVPVPCGKCVACIQRKISEWSFRLETERLNSINCYFVTFTYNNYHVPINKYGKMTLKKEDVQFFFKYLRHEQKRNPDYGLLEEHYYGNNLKNSKVKYYCVGEYGTEKKRPHYHAIIFNVSKQAIIDCWTYGECDIQIPNSSSAITYCMKYLSKRLFEPPKKMVQREFSLMSKGLGESFVKKMGQFYKGNLDILFTANQSGILSPLSKYYRKKILTEYEQKQQIVIVKKSMEDQETKERKLLGDSYDRVKHFEKVAKQNKFIKNSKKRLDL